MITRTVLVKVVVFAVLTGLGVAYTAVRYLDVASGLITREFEVALDLAAPGGIFPTAEVTYRGVGVGEVTDIALRGEGIRVTLELQTDERIPANLLAVVGNGSAVGEQFVDLQPQTSDGPYLTDGSVIPESATRLPVSTLEVLRSLDNLVTSVPREQLQTVVRELGLAFTGRADDLTRLLDSGGLLLEEAQEALPETQRLIADAEQVLATQREQGSAIVSFSRDLRLLTEQLKLSDPDLRAVLDRGVPAAQQLDGLVADLTPSLGQLLADLVGVTEVLDENVNEIQQILIMYPYLVSASLEAFPGDNTARFAVPLNQVGTPACREGYMPVEEWRNPEVTTLRPFPYDSFCSAPPDSGVATRGARNAPPNAATRE